LSIFIFCLIKNLWNIHLSHVPYSRTLWGEYSNYTIEILTYNHVVDIYFLDTFLYFSYWLHIVFSRISFSFSIVVNTVLYYKRLALTQNSSAQTLLIPILNSIEFPSFHSQQSLNNTVKFIKPTLPLLIIKSIKYCLVY